MDSVQKFISENQHQFGYIMHEASRQWIEKDRFGALTVGECNVLIEKYGKYRDILEKMQRYEEALKTVASTGNISPEILAELSREAKKYEELPPSYGATIDGAVNTLLQYRAEGKLACIKFNDVTLYSDRVSLDSAYLEIVGMTKEEFDKEYDKKVQRLFGD